MKLEEVKKLTDDELRIKVAELCGWTEISKKEASVIGWDYLGKPSKDLTAFYAVPRYSTDLNAMHEAEKIVLNMGDEWGRYTDILIDLIVQEQGYQAAELLVYAPARKRAEAFVLMMETIIP